MKEKIFAWMDSIAASPHPSLWLFALAFAESSFFPIPPDVLLISLGVADPERAIWFGLICSIGSVLGGGFGYAIGLYGGRPLLYRFFKAHKVAPVERLYERFNAWATGVAGLTPIPYKIFTIAGGAFKVNFKIFMIASFGSRSLRFMTEGVLLYFYGEQIREVLFRWFNIISVLFVVALIGGFLLVSYLGKRRHETASVDVNED
ncbi:MAG: DedA family protein [bacterium]|nr:DedA family protein [bacterium]